MRHRHRRSRDFYTLLGPSRIEHTNHIQTRKRARVRALVPLYLRSWRPGERVPPRSPSECVCVCVCATIRHSRNGNGTFARNGGGVGAQVTLLGRLYHTGDECVTDCHRKSLTIALRSGATARLICSLDAPEYGDDDKQKQRKVSLTYSPQTPTTHMLMVRLQHNATTTMTTTATTSATQSPHTHTHKNR